MGDEDFRIACALRLGSSLSYGSKCKCGLMMDEQGLHAFVCKKSGGLHQRHSMLNHLIKTELERLKINSVLEPTNLVASEALRPDGVTVVPWSRGKPLSWDVSCGHPNASSYISRTIKAAGDLCEKMEEKKLNKYLLLQEKCVFQPLCFETFGGMGPSTRSFIHELMRRARGVSHLSGEEETNYIFQRFSLQLQKGNALCIRCSSV